MLLTCSCSGLVSPEDFVGLLRGVALDLRSEARFLGVYGAAPDHPVSSSFPEGRYLKAVLVAPGPQALAQGILAVLCDPVRAEHLAHAARRYAQTHLGWSRFVDSVEDLYAEVERHASVARP